MAFGVCAASVGQGGCFEAFVLQDDEVLESKSF